MPFYTGVQIKKDSWSFTFDQASIAANSGAVSAAQTAPGATVGGIYFVKRPSGLAAGIHIEAECTTAGQIVIRFFNVTAGALDPASLTYEVAQL